MKITFLWFISFIMALIFMVLPQTLKKSSNNKKNSWGHFECGFNTMNPSLSLFSFQFFLISLLFLIFDVEIALVISFPMEPLSMKKLWTFFLFITFLTLGLMYEWQKGKISWSK